MASPLFYLRRPSLGAAPPPVVEVLLIEDNLPDAEMVIEMLADEVGAGAARFTHVTRLDQALELLEAHSFDIALADMSLPDVYGLDVVTRLQAAAPSLPIVVLSGGTDIDTAVGAVNAGAQDYLVKGRIDGNQLLRAIHYAVERKRTADQLQQLLGTLEMRVAERTAALKAANGMLRTQIAERQNADAALRISEAKYRELTELASDAIFITDNDGCFVETNQSASALLGYDREEMQQLNVRDVTVSDMNGAAPEGFAEVQSGEAVLQQLVMRRKDGTLVQTESSAKMLPDGRIQAIVRDVTERIRLEQERQSRLAAEQAYEAKNEFLSRMSHELRTPLNAILGFGQLLQLDELLTEQQESVAYIMQAGRHLLELVDEVLDITRLDKGMITLNMEVVPIAEFLLQAISHTADIRAERQITMRSDLALINAITVWADRERLGHVLSNVLNNAIVYNHRGGSVVVRAEPAGDSEDLCIKVTNTGPGIAAEKIGLLFMPFERLGNATGNVKGTGLGLVLARLLVGEMGGEIGVESDPGNETTFWIKLPIAVGSVLQPLQSTSR